MTRRRIARLITRLNIGGPSIQAIDLSRALTAQGFDTCLIHGRVGPSEGDMRARLPLGETMSVYVETLVRPISPWRDARTLWRLYRELCRWKPAIVHTHMAKAGALGRLAALVYNRTAGTKQPARLVHTYHGHVFEGYFGSPSTRVFLFVERWLGRRTDALVAISPQIREDVLRTYRIGSEANVTLIPLGFALEGLADIGPADRARARLALDIPDGVQVVTTVGRLTAIKQHGLFLDAAERIAQGGRPVVFLVAGDGELRSELEARVAGSGLRSQVRFLGWRNDLATLYGATDVFLLTSRNEGTPVALIEAMASGVASVSTDVGGVRDVIASADAGSLAPFGDADALSAAVSRFLDDPVLRTRVGENARRSVLERFDSRRLVRDIESLYTRLLETAS